MEGTFVGFGFGAIQGGLFLPEAFRSGNFGRLVVSEIDQESVDHLRASGGVYSCNVACESSLARIEIAGVEAYNPLVEDDRRKLVDAISEASELCTALPSFKLYDSGPASVASLLSEGLDRKFSRENLPPAVVYAAENDSRAASRLHEACLKYRSEGFAPRVAFSETVIAKMCSVVTDLERIRDEGLIPIADRLSTAFLVEAYDRILVEEKMPEGFERGLDRFVTKTDLDPFAQTKFLGHNALHAMLGYLAKARGINFMHEVGKDSILMEKTRATFLGEAGTGLRKEYAEVQDELFTEAGFRAYAEDALVRMVNPFLRDSVERVTRDPARKLGWEDRLLGAMKLARRAGVEPKGLAEGARVALRFACQEEGWGSATHALDELWKEVSAEEQAPFRDLLLSSPN
jgi:mannitol-1-phosphate 5-dehydrogenase